MFVLYIRKWNIVRFVILVYVFFFFMKGFCIKYKNLKSFSFLGVKIFVVDNGDE